MSVKVLGGAVAVLSVGDAIYSWSTTKGMQQAVRNTLDEFKNLLKEMEKVCPGLE